MRYIVFLILTVLGISQMNAQTVSMSILKSGKWEWTYPDLSHRRITTFQFTDTQMQEEIYFVKLKKRHLLEHRFYLADEPTSQFNGKMVGKTQSGKYLVYETMNNRATSFEILSATTTQIKMKNPLGDICILTRQ